MDKEASQLAVKNALRNLQMSNLTASAQHDADTLRVLAEVLRTPGAKMDLHPEFLELLADEFDVLVTLCDRLAYCVRSYYGINETGEDLESLASGALIAYHLVNMNNNKE